MPDIGVCAGSCRGKARIIPRAWPHVVLVRHGQASFGAADYDVLSETGRRQAGAAGEALRGRIGEVRAVVTGSMRRQRETAAACLEAMGLAAPGRGRRVERVRPRGGPPRLRAALGGPRRAPPRARGRGLRRAFERAFLAAVARWTGGAHDADYRETWPGFLARVDGALARLPRAPGGTVLVFTSGGPISAACRAHLGAATRRPSSRTRFASRTRASRRSRSGRRASFSAAFNDHAHLTGRDEGLLTFR
jgi:broad specificity phosphatase PhoE